MLTPDDDKTRTHMTLTSGTMVSHYRIIEKIGSGGMGEVYLAEDTELNRKVALKFLPSHLCQDADCRARFKREAQAAARLSHPNIITIYEVSEFNSRPYFAMEHIEGVSLDEYVKERSLTWQEVIGLVIQIAEGLGEAHRCGVIHRDIKPSNILADKMGRVKILDFGLAAIKGVDKLTKTGSTLGTLHYMSPEQTRGESLDERSDIFSFGILVYEMIAGHLPYGGEHEAAIIYSIGFEEAEPLARYKSGVSKKLQEIVTKALAKNKNQRYQHVTELLDDLRKERLTSDVLSPAYGKPSLHRVGLWTIVCFIVAIAIVVGFQVLRKSPSTAALISRKQLTFLGNAKSPALSPDGKSFAYVTKSADGTNDVVHVQDVSGSSARSIFEASEIYTLSWSPDGIELLASVRTDSGDKTALIDRLGSNHRFYPIRGWSIDWSPDGNQFVVAPNTESHLYLVNKRSGEITTVSTAFDDKPIFDVAWSPGGLRLAVITWRIAEDRGTLWTCAVDGSHAEKVLDTTTLACTKWAPLGEALYFLIGKGTESPDLMKVSLNPKTGKRAGDIRLVLSGLQGSNAYTISGDGHSLAFSQGIEWSNLWRLRVDEHGMLKEKPLALTTGTSSVLFPSVSPNGFNVAFARSTPQGELHIFTVPIDGGECCQVTHTGRSNTSPAWSPDASKIAYSSWADTGGTTVSVTDILGGPPRALVACDGHSLITWAPGPRILYSEFMDMTYHVLNPETGDVTAASLRPPFRRACRAVYAPDARHYAVISTRLLDTLSASSERIRELNILDLTSDTKVSTWRIGPEYASCLGWSADNRWVYLCTYENFGARIIRFGVADGTEQEVTRLQQPGAQSIAMGPDCRTFVYILGDSKSDIWLVSGFDPDVK